MTARFRNVLGAAAPFFFLLVFSVSAPAAVSTASSPQAEGPAKNPPFELAKKTSHGLFPEEIISIQDLRARQTEGKKTVILDARGKQSYEAGHIAGAVLPLTPAFYAQEEKFRQGLLKMPPDREKDLPAGVAQYDKNATVVTYCNDECQAGAVLLIQLKRLGFKDVFALDPGYQSWQKAGYPVEPAPVPAAAAPSAENSSHS